jgi:predicted RNA polymerase sigma factor
LLDDPVLERYQPLHATHADLLKRVGDRPAAARAYRQAIALSANAVERAELERRLHGLHADSDRAGPQRPTDGERRQDEPTTA